MVRKILFLIVLLFIYNLCGTFQQCREEEGWLGLEANCDDIGSASYHQNNNWNALRIYNKYNRSLVPLKTAAFTNLKHLRSLQIENSINSIEPNAFQHLQISDISLKYNKLSIIESESFSSSSRGLVSIILENNGILHISPFMVKETDELHNFQLINERIKIFPRQVFYKAPKLYKIEIRNTEIAIIQDEAFYNLPSLSDLVLTNNQIKYFNSSALFSNSNVMSLSLSNNKLTHNSIVLKGLTNLTVLALNANLLERIEPALFEDQTKLNILYLENNYLVHIYSHTLPSSLWRLDLSFNNLTYLQPTFFQRFNLLKRVYLVGNPWQCTCWYNIRQKLYDQGITLHKSSTKFFKGILPVCVVNIGEDEDQCVESDRFSKEYSEIFYGYLNTYGKYPDDYY